MDALGDLRIKLAILLRKKEVLQEPLSHMLKERRCAKSRRCKIHHLNTKILYLRKLIRVGQKKEQEVRIKSLINKLPL